MHISLTAELAPCNRTDVIAVLANITSGAQDDEKRKAYDHEGAMEFIVATLLVYCLLGISGLLLLRVRRRASRSQRTVTLREEHIQEYIKHAEELRLSGYRDKLKIEARRMMSQIETIERRKSETTNAFEVSFQEECSALNSYTYDAAVSYHQLARPKFDLGDTGSSPTDTTPLIKTERGEEVPGEENSSNDDMISLNCGSSSREFHDDDEARKTDILEHIVGEDGKLNGMGISNEINDMDTEITLVKDNACRMNHSVSQYTFSPLDHGVSQNTFSPMDHGVSQNTFSPMDHGVSQNTFSPIDHGVSQNTFSTTLTPNDSNNNTNNLNTTSRPRRVNFLAVDQT
ncbi:hypothetical protein Bpfe_031342 [Biomphalaria pfeifferi]|uniref:Uncharacterized protein n=1 Tax=Biomphalaria pfeifferi TaxID=112525 RepID=A0AAD8ESZ6_BIOPF|nr:hypothetical protein Bpfe_031342 [Biomphalaria pfeifferi]